jgi:hypothetical protein
MVLLATLMAASASWADERESLEVLRQTTLNLINVLVEQGVMTREKADTLVRAAEQKAAETVAAQAKADEGKPPADGKSRIRVTYVPETVKKELREQIRQEVLAQAKTERWGEPGALPDWVQRMQWEGDVRFRYQSEKMDKNNSPASDYVNAVTLGAFGPSTTRAADFGVQKNKPTDPVFVPTANTQEDRQRERIRARLGLLAKASDDFSVGFRLATGSTTDRVSTNQSLGQDFNKYQFLLDRAYVKYEPNEFLRVWAGRIPNPWFSTDLVWSENLNFEGVAATLGKHKSQEGQDSFQPYLTVGAFPLREKTPPTRDGRMLYGSQAGFQWNLSSRTRFKLGAAYYNYHNMQGRQEGPDAFLVTSSTTSIQQTPNYGQYEYESGLRQKGNTLFLTNSVNDYNTATTPLWGLAARFREVDLTAALDLAHWDPVHFTMIADYVKNVGYDRNEIFGRTGLTAAELPDGRKSGSLLKLQIGRPEINDRHDWNAYVAYRYLGSDAVLDAFTNSDFGLGGTNNKGYILGFNYGFDRNVSLGVRLLSADSIDSMIPIAAQSNLGFSSAKIKYSVDVLQVDLNARF